MFNSSLFEAMLKIFSFFQKFIYLTKVDVLCFKLFNIWCFKTVVLELKIYIFGIVTCKAQNDRDKTRNIKEF